MRKLSAVMLILAGAALAGPAAVPEIDPASATSGLALLGGLALMIRGRRAR